MKRLALALAVSAALITPVLAGDKHVLQFSPQSWAMPLIERRKPSATTVTPGSKIAILRTALPPARTKLVRSPMLGLQVSQWTAPQHR